MPVLRTIARPPIGDSVMVQIPEEYRGYSIEIIVAPVVDDGKPKKYNLSHLAGRLRLRKDPVAFQRELRDEW